MKRLNYNQLYYFYVIASLGSIKNACKKLHLTQPTISGQLKALEEDLGFPLFDRKYRKLELNRMGRHVLKKIETVFLASEELALTLPDVNSNCRKDFRVAALKTLPVNFVYDFCFDHSLGEELKMDVITGDIDTLIKKMNQDKVDIILSDIPYRGVGTKYKSINLGESQLYIVGPAIYGEENFPEKLNNIPFLHFSKKSPLHEDIEMYFKINNIQPDIIGYMDDIELIKKCLYSEKAVTILPKETAESIIDKSNIKKLGVIEDIHLNHWAIISYHSEKKVTVQKFINQYLNKNKSYLSKEIIEVVAQEQAFLH